MNVALALAAVPTRTFNKRFKTWQNFYIDMSAATALGSIGVSLVL